MESRCTPWRASGWRGGLHSLNWHTFMCKNCIPSTPPEAEQTWHLSQKGVNIGRVPPRVLLLESVLEHLPRGKKKKNPSKTEKRQKKRQRCLALLGLLVMGSSEWAAVTSSMALVVVSSKLWVFDSTSVDNSTTKKWKIGMIISLHRGIKYTGGKNAKNGSPPIPAQASSEAKTLTYRKLVCPPNAHPWSILHH